jgi:hypothetical protein
MDVHSVGFLENWGFGDFQFLKSNPNEQPIETSHLEASRSTSLREALNNSLSRAKVSPIAV